MRHVDAHVFSVIKTINSKSGNNVKFRKQNHSCPIRFISTLLIGSKVISRSSVPDCLKIDFLSLLFLPRSGELRTQKLKSHLVRTQSLNIFPLKPGVGQYLAIHATLTARDFFLAYFYTSGPFTSIFSKTSPEFSLCWLWLAYGSCVGSQNKMGHPAGCRFPC